MAAGMYTRPDATTCGSLQRKLIAAAPTQTLYSRQSDSRGELFKKITGWELKPMEWVTPQHESIDLHCEVSSYANAEL